MGEKSHWITELKALETKSKPPDEVLRDLIEIIQFMEKVSTKIRGMFDEAEIYRVVMEEFKKSRRYTTSIVLLTDDGMKLRIAATSLSPEKLKVGERAAGLQMKEYTIDLNKSSIYRQVVKEGKTVHVSVNDIIGELFPRPLAHLISKTMGYEKKKSVMVPLRHHEKIIGIFAMTSTELAEYFIPSVRNLAQHISTALELAYEHAERKQTEEEKERGLHNLGERVKELNCLYGFSKLVEQPNGSLEKIFQGIADLIPFSWQYPNITCARVVFENKEFKTDNFRITKWKQSADVKVYGKTSGTIEVYYLEKKPEIDEGPFLKEERDLLEAIAERLGHIIERKQNEEELKKYRRHLEELVEERAVELTKTNKQLQHEIIERKKAEGETIRTKEHLQNIINSASEIVISFDNNNRVTTWNKTVELLTRFKQREVIGRHVTKLPVFDNPQELSESLKSISYGKKHGLDALVLTTKDNTKRICKISCSTIKSDKDQPCGVLCVGKDITHDVESHGRLLKGNSYLISDKSNRSALEFFVGLTISGYRGLFITRATPGMIKSMIPSKDIQVVLLKQTKIRGFENIQNLDGLTATIKEFSRKNTNSVILLDRVDYLLTNFSFEKFVQTLYQINDIISENKPILLFHLDPSIVDKRQMAIIENELQPLPSQKIEGIEIEDELYDILKFIYEQNQDNSIVSFKKVSKEFSIVSKTTTKRLRKLENKGLILVKKQGKTKTLRVSNKGKTLLHKRQII